MFPYFVYAISHDSGAYAQSVQGCHCVHTCLDARKLAFGTHDQVTFKPACTATESR